MTAPETPVSQPNSSLSTRSRVLIVGATIAFIVLVWGFSTWSAGESGTEANAEGTESSELHQFTFATADGGVTTLAAHSGEPLVINYFAAWCPPCRAELPDFEQVHQEVGDQVTFIGVSRDNTTGSWIGLIDEVGVTYETLYEGNIRGSFEFVEGRGMPTTVFVTEQGEIAKVFSGALNDDLLRELINEHLT